MSLDAVENAFLHFRFLRHAAGHEVDCGIESQIPFLKMYFGLVEETGLLYRNVNQSRLRTVRHGVPAVAAQRSRSERGCLAAFFIARAYALERTARRGIDSGCPGDRGVRLGGNDFSRGAIEDVKVTVFRSLKENLSRCATDGDVGQNDRGSRIVVPGITRHFLVMPKVLTRFRFERHDRAGEKIISALRAAHAAVPRSSVARSDVEQIELGIINYRIPHCSTPAELPPCAAPSFRGLLERRTFKRLRGITWDCVEAPCELSRVRVVGRHVAAHTHFRAAVADEHLALHDARRARDRVTILGIDGESFPCGFSGGRVEGNEAAVECADKNFSAPNCDAAIHHVAARIYSPLWRDLWIVGPEFLARRRVHGKDFAPGC